jgi:hypothetical protein
MLLLIVKIFSYIPKDQIENIFIFGYIPKDQIEKNVVVIPAIKKRKKS